MVERLPPSMIDATGQPDGKALVTDGEFLVFADAGLTEAEVRVIIGEALLEGSGITITDNGDGTFTIAATSTGVPTTRQIIAGTGLTGGGDLSVDRTLAIDTTAEAERIRDVIGAALVQGSNITITVNDAGDTITIAATTSPALQPLTTEIGGVPDLVWDDNNSLVMTEATP